MENLDQLNAQLRETTAEEIIAWAARQPGPLIASTSFGPNSGALLHLISRVAPDTPVVWVDSGFNMRDTYVVAQELIERLNLNMKIYVPSVTTERLNVLMGGTKRISTRDSPASSSSIPLTGRWTKSSRGSGFRGFAVMIRIFARVWTFCPGTVAASLRWLPFFTGLTSGSTST